MGPQFVYEVFKQTFEDTPENYKYFAAPVFKVWFTDALAKLNCIVDDCDDLQDRKDAAQYVLDTVEPYISSGGGGGGGGS